jgi:proteasome beta subunit
VIDRSVDSQQSGPLPLEFPSDGSFTSLLMRRGELPRWDTGVQSGDVEIPEGTTILALRFRDGVVMAGDRRATAGNIIAHRRMRKVFPADSHSGVAISGTAGMAVELIKLFQTELEHYEKIEGDRLSLEGKANYLARMVRGNLPMAFQGLVVVPLFAGFDTIGNSGRLYTFDVVGGRYEEQDYAATGSGGMEARAFLKGAFRDDLDRQDALAIAVEALVAAAEEDAATGGPDLRRGIFPNVITVTSAGFVEADDDEIAGVAAQVMEARP